MRTRYSPEKEKQRIFKVTVFAVLAVVIAVTTVGSNLASSRMVEITSPEELEKIGRQEGYPIDGEYVLTTDIDGGGRTISAIGSKDRPFAGHFDGKGHTIRNLVVKVKEEREIRAHETVIEVQSGETAALGVSEEKEPQEASTEKLIVSVDGYPLFEYTAEETPGQIENLCLDRLQTVKETEQETESDTKKAKTQENRKQEEKPSKPDKIETAIEIHSWEEFKNIGNTKYDPAYTMDAVYILVKDIKSDGKKFTPIGTRKQPFTGRFDGQGKKIDVSANPEIRTDTANSGLFGVVKPASGEEDGNEK